MDQIYAKLKRQRIHPFRKIASDQKLFDLDPTTIGSRLEYDPGTILDEDDWFRISNFSSEEYYPDYLRNEVNSVDIAALKKNEFDNISCLVAVQNGSYFFQRVRPSTFMRRKAIAFGDSAYLEESKNRLLVNSLPDAIYTPSSDELVFRDLVAITPLFSGIDTLFKAATDEEVKLFLANEFIDADILPERISKPNRKRIAAATAALAQMSPVDKQNTIHYISSYCATLAYDPTRGVFKISTDEDVKQITFGIEERFYTTPIGQEKRLANSVVKIQ